MEYSNLRKYFWNFLVTLTVALSSIFVHCCQDSVQFEICFGVLLPSYTFYPKKYLNFSKKEKVLPLKLLHGYYKLNVVN